MADTQAVSAAPLWVDFSNEQEQKKLSKTLKANVERFGHVRRAAGSYIHAFAYGKISLDHILDILAAQPDIVLTCIDEHSQLPEGKGIICSHAACGAAEAIYAELRSELVNPEVKNRMTAFLGEETVNDVLDGILTSDGLGKRWSLRLMEELKEKRGVKLSHQHIGVERYRDSANHAKHSATGASVHFAPSKIANFLEGKPEVKPFIITRTEYGPSFDQMNVTAREAALSAAIAFGGHGVAKEHGSYTIMVHDATSEEKKRFEELLRFHLIGFLPDTALLAQVSVVFLS